MSLGYLWLAALLFSFCSCGASNDNGILPDDGGDGSGETVKKQKLFYADPTIILDNTGDKSVPAIPGYGLTPVL